MDVQALISDGNYGNERVTVGYKAEIAEGEDVSESTFTLVALAREHVYTAAKHSPREGIRHAMETPDEQTRRYIFETAEREANEGQYRKKLEAWRREAREAYGLPVGEDTSSVVEDTPF